MDDKDVKTDAAKPDTAGLELDGDPMQMIQGLMTSLQERFQSMSDQIINRIDTMSARMNELEQGIVELGQQFEQISQDAKPDTKPEAEAPTSTS